MNTVTPDQAGTPLYVEHEAYSGIDEYMPSTYRHRADSLNEDIEQVISVEPSDTRVGHGGFADGTDPFLRVDELVCPTHHLTYLASAGCGECHFDKTGLVRKVTTSSIIDQKGRKQ